jgi:hypothetical protein
VKKSAEECLFSEINRIFANRLTPPAPEIHQTINGYVRKNQRTSAARTC